MCAREAFIAIDSEVLNLLYRGFFSRPGDVETANGKIGVLHIEIICVADRAILVCWNGHVGYSLREQG